MSAALQGKKWCYTINNPTDDDVLAAYALGGPGDSSVLYHVCGLEHSAETSATVPSGTPHLQGYLVFVTNMRFGAVRSMLPRAHLELARGTHAQNREYCSKEGNFFENGIFPEDARRGNGPREERRWSEARIAAQEGRIEDIDSNLYIPYYRTLLAIRKDHMKPPEDLGGTCGEWFFGPSGVGKSWKARQENPTFYYKLANKWWDGYQDQDVVLIEDLDPSHKVLGHHLKLWADRYAFTAEVKGGAISIRPKKIVVTSQYRVEEVFDDPATVEALKRRFTLREFRIAGFPGAQSEQSQAVVSGFVFPSS